MNIKQEIDRIHRLRQEPIISLDFETQSKCDLIDRGVFPYVEPEAQTAVLVACYKFWNEPGVDYTWIPSMEPLPDNLKAHIDAGRLITAWNAGFEFLMLTRVLGLPVDIGQMVCTAAQARACALPGALDNCARSVGAPVNKDPRGKSLITLYSLPNADGSLTPWCDIPEEDQQAWREYCRGDVILEYTLAQYLLPQTDREIVEYQQTERINNRGMCVDLAMARDVVTLSDAVQADVRDQIYEVTGRVVPGATDRTLRDAWLTHGYYFLHATEEVFCKTKPKWYLISAAQDMTKCPNYVCLDNYRFIEPRLGEEELSYLRKPATVEQQDNGEPGDVTFDKRYRADLLAANSSNLIELPDDVLRYFELLDEAGGATISKYSSAIKRAVAIEGQDVVPGSYLFEGAGQTGRFCVDGGTLIETEGGLVKIAAIAPGTKVLTHKNRYMPVLDKCFKGYEKMYRVTTAGGGDITCTANHRILTQEGWKSVKELKGFEKRGVVQSGDGILHVRRLSDDGGNSSEVRVNVPHGERVTETGAAAGGAAGAQECKQVACKGGQQESEVRSSFDSNECDRGLPGTLDRRKGGAVRAGASTCFDERDGPETMAAGVGSTSPGRGQAEQHLGQPMHSNKERASGYSSYEIRKIESVGTRGVWDIEVDEDHSYVAGRFVNHNSSKGLQLHNLRNRGLPDGNHEDVIEQVAVAAHAQRAQGGNETTSASAATELAKVAELSGTSIMDTFAFLVRNMIVAPEDGHLIWSDWSSIEGRVLPWLANTAGGDAKLAEIDAGVDQYVKNAAVTYGVPISEVTADQRQSGKVQELSLGFGGGAGALKAMGRNFGVAYTTGEAEQAKNAWRLANAWAPDYWDVVANAATGAVFYPGEEFKAGRVSYKFFPEIMGGSLLACLPSGRVLVYPGARFDTIYSEKFDADQRVLTSIAGNILPKAGDKGWPRKTLWSGLLAENITQAAAADVLREAILRIDSDELCIVGTTHDEVICETDDYDIEAKCERLTELMCEAPAWAEGLPLAAETKHGYCYSK